MARGKKKRRTPAEPEEIQESPAEAVKPPETSTASSSPPWWRSLIPFLAGAVLLSLVAWLFTGGALLGFLGPALFIAALYVPFHYFLEQRLADQRKESKATRLSIPKPRSRVGRCIEFVVIVALALGLALAIQAWLVKPYRIPSGSMEPTLDIGQQVVVNRIIYHFKDPQIGDIVVFHPPKGADESTVCGVPRKDGEPCPKPTREESSQNFIKRIVAGPGDTLSVKDGHPVVNGVEKNDEPYINACGASSECNLPKAITVPPDMYFMMGDNRGRSDDSRFWGPVPRDWIIGEAIATYWPPDRWGLF